MIDRGVLGTDILSSLISVVAGYVLGFVIALPVAILMAWYKPVRYIIEPWIQFTVTPTTCLCTTYCNCGRCWKKTTDHRYHDCMFLDNVHYNLSGCYQCR